MLFVQIFITMELIRREELQLEAHLWESKTNFSLPSSALRVQTQRGSYTESVTLATNINQNRLKHGTM